MLISLSIRFGLYSYLKNFKWTKITVTTLFNEQKNVNERTPERHIAHNDL